MSEETNASGILLMQKQEIESLRAEVDGWVKYAENISESLGRMTADHAKLVAECAAVKWALTGVIAKFADEYEDLTDGGYGTVEDFAEVKAARKALSTPTGQEL